jgi:hypothetical protein
MSGYPPVVQAQPYSKAIAAKKVLGSIGTVLAAIAPAVLPSLIDYFSSDANVATVLKVDPKLLGLAPFIAGAIRLIANYRKQTR